MATVLLCLRVRGPHDRETSVNCKVLVHFQASWCSCDAVAFGFVGQRILTAPCVLSLSLPSYKTATHPNAQATHHLTTHPSTHIHK